MCLKHIRAGLEKPEYKIFSRKFFEVVPRPDFCDGKKLSRGREMYSCSNSAPRQIFVSTKI
jgi:cobalamin biosynthesis protein CobT